jgi:hypothetical protein
MNEAKQAKDNNVIWRMLFACSLTKAADTATIISRTHLKITLCLGLHCLSFFVWLRRSMGNYDEIYLYLNLLDMEIKGQCIGSATSRQIHSTELSIIKTYFSTLVSHRPNCLAVSPDLPHDFFPQLQLWHIRGLVSLPFVGDLHLQCHRCNTCCLTEMTVQS